MIEHEALTGDNVRHMHVLHSAAVLPDRGARFAVPVALVGAGPIPVHLLTPLAHSKMETNARQRPAPHQGRNFSTAVEAFVADRIQHHNSPEADASVTVLIVC